MNVSRALLALPLLCLALVSDAATRPADVTATQAQTRATWQRYWRDELGAVPSITFPYQECFERAAAAHDMPLSLLLALARGESNFDPNAASDANAHGLMQIQWPGTASDLGIDSMTELVKPCVNVEAGTRYLKMLLERYEGDVHLSLAAYNYGLGRIERGAERVPDGAAWYSGYIYNHLRYVLGRSAPEAIREAPANYADEQRQTIITFLDERNGGPGARGAEGFVEHLRESVPEARLDWFDSGLGRFSVDLLYQDEEERARSVELIRSRGFTVPDDRG